MRSRQFVLPIASEMVVDLFAGGGGASTGIEQAIGRHVDIAVNHDPQAISLHTVNHPQTRHFVSDVFEVDPLHVTGGKPVRLLWASPDCKHFSKAKGGRPVSRKIRGLAWVVVRWAKAVRPRIICLENVEEFQTWGPLGDDGRPCPARKGETFRKWTAQLRALGYAIEWRELRASDYGAPTSRKRFFMVARCDGQPINWPTPTHGPSRKPWRTAAECIDWSIPCPSIFNRTRPLAEATMRRIAAGVMRYVVNASDPFIVPAVGGGVAPFITEHANASNQRNMRADEPVRTICAQVKGGHFALVAPTLVQVGYGEREGQSPRAIDVQKPLGTIVGTGKHALVAAFLAKHYTGVVGQDLRRPIGTVTAVDHHSLVRAFLVAYYGNEREGISLNDPMRTVVSRDRFGLVTVWGQEYAIADIGLRMLQPRELYRAQGFPDSYVIEAGADGAAMPKDAQVRMCGNSVCPPLARAIVAANYVEPEMAAANDNSLNGRATA